MDRKSLGILVVEDNAMMQKMITAMLEGLGFQKFTLAPNGKVAWQKLTTGEPIHLIISDLNMPEMDGIELLEKVRSSEKFWDLPFVIITAEENQSQLFSSIEIEVDSYILKPFTPIKLEEEISRVLDKKFNPSPYTIALQEGRSLLAMGEDSATTMAAFKTAIRLQPLEADPYYFSAIIHDREGRHAEAKACLEKCILLKEAYPKAYDLMGLIFHREKNYTAERKILSRISELSPHKLERNLNLALASVKIGDQDGVRKCLKIAARRVNPDDLATYERIFKIYLEDPSMAAEAETVYKKYIDKKMNNPRLLNKFALHFKEIKDYERAIFFLERIVHIWRTSKDHGIPPEDMAVFYFNLGVATIEQANTYTDAAQKNTGYKTAAKVLDKAIDCSYKHAGAQKLYEWVTARLK
ncbi:MAG: response regulator [Proteobacteria bacterium]|nr:response regulator [Desulfobulbaceae bacterium]MBU4154016.1 response regulator [Pseudomonadota bacterium]MDP2104397.1 response regulator [Desulfobulbaceae bacterium]